MVKSKLVELVHLLVEPSAEVCSTGEIETQENQMANYYRRI